MPNMLYDAFTGSLTVGDAAWIILRKLNPATDIKAAVSLLSNLIDNIRLAFAGDVTPWQVLKIVPDFAMTVAGLIPGVKALSIISDAYSIANIL